MNNYLQLIEFFPFSRILQIILIVFLYLLTANYVSKNIKKLNKKIQSYQYFLEFCFAPIYEEIIFRGLLFAGLLTIFGLIESVLISSIAFGLWHYKNIYFGMEKMVYKQMIFTTIIGCIWGLIVYYIGTIWLIVIWHYIHNLVSIRQIIQNKEKNKSSK